MSDENEKEEKKLDPWAGSRPVESKKLTRREKIRSRLRKPQRTKKTPRKNRTKWEASRWKAITPTSRVLKCFVALVLLFLYFVTSATSAPIRPEILVLFIPTMLVLLDYIRLSWYREEGGQNR